MYQRKTYRLCILGIFLTVSIMLSYIEYLIPIHLGIPGIKLGLANIITILLLNLLSEKEACIIALIRVFIMGILFTGIHMMLYSLSGTVLSLIVMIVLHRMHLFKTATISVMGGIFHNAGQILCAVVMYQTVVIMYYLPVLVVSGIVAGMLTGVLANLLENRIGYYIEGKIHE